MSWVSERPIQRFAMNDDGTNAGGSPNSFYMLGTYDGSAERGFRFAHPGILTRISAGCLVNVADSGTETNVLVWNNSPGTSTNQVFDAITLDMSSTGSVGDSETAIANSGKELFIETDDILIEFLLDAGSFELLWLWAVLEYQDLRV